MKLLKFAVASMLSVSAFGADAGVYTDDLTKCLVSKTNADDRTALVRWMFIAMTQHPVVADLSNAKQIDVDKASATAGALFTRLLTEACVDAARSAIKYEGAAAIQASFGVLGQVASADLFSDPKVNEVMAGLEKHIDQEKIATLAK